MPPSDDFAALAGHLALVATGVYLLLAPTTGLGAVFGLLALFWGVLGMLGVF